MTATMRPPLPTVTRVVPIVELGVGSVTAPGGNALWQNPSNPGSVESKWQNAAGSDDAATSDWSGRDPQWIDVSCHVREVSTFCGRERSIDLWEVGTATISVDNVDGWADWPLSNDPDELLAVRPGLPVRVGVLVDGTTTHYLWGGYVDSTQPGYHPEDGEFVVLECIDAKGEAGRSFLGELAAPVGAAEASSARVNRVLTAANWPTYRRDIQANAVALRATTYGAQVVDLLNLAADSSGGACFGDVNGNVAFRQRDWQASSILAEPAGIIGNTGDAAEVCPTEWELSFNREDISTRIVVGRPDEPPAVAVDSHGFGLFGDETYERVDLETNLDAELINLRDRILAVRRFGVEITRADGSKLFVHQMPRVAAVSIDAATDPKAVDLLATISPYTPSVIACRHRGVNGRIVIDRSMMLVGIEQTISPEGWSARLALDSAFPFQVTATNGKWNAPGGTAGYWQPAFGTAPTPPATVTTWSPGV